jgi:hypothetical protein
MASLLESNTTTAQANLAQRILAAKNAYREAEDIDPTSSDNDALKSIWIALLADLKKLQSNELAIAADLVKVMKTLIYANGDTYIGKISEGDEKKGKGRFTCEKNGTIYDGEFQLDKMHGHGTMTWPDGNKYVGEYKNGKRDGNGTYTAANGDRYVGEYTNDKKHGQGTETLADGTIFHSGEWVNDKPKK